MNTAEALGSWVLGLEAGSIRGSTLTTAAKEGLTVLRCLESTLGGVTRNPERKLKNLRPSAAQGDSFLGSCGPSELEDQAFLPGTKRAYRAIPPQPPARSIRPVPRPELQGAVRNQLVFKLVGTNLPA